MESQFTVRIPLALAAKLKRVAKDSRRTRSDLVRMALEKFLSALGEPLEPVPTTAFGISSEAWRVAFLTWGRITGRIFFND